MRDLLFLAHRIPFPPDRGDKIRSFHILQYLATRFRVHLGCFFDDSSDERHIGRLREMCAQVFCLPLPRAKKVLLGLRGAVFGTSMSEAVYKNRCMHEWTRKTLAAYDINDIFVFCSAMSPYVRECLGGRRFVIDMVDVDSEKWGAYARLAPWPLGAFYHSEQRRVRDLEVKAAESCDRALFVSKAEADIFLTLAPHLCSRAGHLENGVNFDWFDPSRGFDNPFQAAVLPIVFTGAMDYRPNVDAATWFAREVFPAVREVCARAEFWIVGSNPSASVRRLSQQQRIKVTGTVADVRPYLAKARCAVAPMRIARGVQNKVLEAMAMAKPVVLTPAALEGLSAVPGREVLVASTAQEFARHVSDLLSGQESAIGCAARRRVERDHSWARNLEALDLLFEESAALPVARSAAKAIRANVGRAVP